MTDLLEALKSYYKRAKENVVNTTKPYVQQPTKIITQGVPNLVKSAVKTAKEAPRDLGTGLVKSFQAKKDADLLLSQAKRDAEISQQNIKRAVELKKAGNTEGYKSLLASNNRNTSNNKGVDNFLKQTEADKRKTVVAGVKTAGLLPGVFKPGVGSYVAAGGLSAGLGAVTGEDPFTAAGRGVTQAKQYSLVGQFSNPLIRQVSSSASGKFNNPLVRALSYRALSGLGNVGEDEILGRTQYKTPSNKERAASFLIGSAMGGKYKGPDKREANFTTLLKTQLEKGAKIELDPVDAARLDKAMKVAGDTYKQVEPSLKKALDVMGDTIGLTTKERIAQRIDELAKKERLTADEMKMMPRFNESKEDAVDRVYQELRRKTQSGAIDFSAEVNPKQSPELPKSEPLPWEEPQYQAKYGGVEAASTGEPKIKTGRIKQELDRLQTESNQQNSYTSVSPELTADVKQIEKLAPKKVNIVDYIRTPDRVLKKIGLEKEGQLVRESYNKYLDELPKEIDRVTQWYEQTKNIPNASQNIFKYLDGQKVTLSEPELKVAGEMQAYLKEWADKLDLPYDSRVTHYITHIFEKDFIQKDFDEDLAKIITDKIPGSVYDPFLQKRLGQQGYVEDVFRALDAYVKRATRKFNMDPALEQLQKRSEALPLESWKYVKSYADRINLRPTDMDNLLDNLIKQSPIGYKLGSRPVTSLTRSLRQMVYRGTLGLNIGSAIRNLTQGVNTYSKLGEKYTGIGYFKAFQEIFKGGDELKQVGVLRDNIVQDRKLSAVKGLMEKMDNGLFAFFNLAEKINRGSAYYGAKAKFLSQGLSEEQAIKKAVDLVRQTQFTFGSVDTPVALQSDIVKTLTQFQSFNVKQTEFLAEMVKGREFKGMARWLGANMLIMATVGKLIGLEPKDMIPFSGMITGDTKLGETPITKTIGDVGGAVLNTPDEYGNVSEDPMYKRVAGAIGKNAPAFIPGGSQIKKTVQGIGAVNQEGSYNKNGKLQFPIEKTGGNYVQAGLFGKSNLPGAQEYYDNPKPLSEQQTEKYKNAPDKKEVYGLIESQRKSSNEEDKIYESIKKGDLTGLKGGQPKTSAEAVLRYLNSESEEGNPTKEQKQQRYLEMASNLSPEVKAELTEILKLEKQGFSKADRGLLIVPEELRSRAVYDRLKSLDKKNRAAKYQQLVQAGIITPSMKPVLIKLLKGEK